MRFLISNIIITVLIISSTNILFAQQKYLLDCKRNLLEASLDTAKAQVGTIELTGYNDGDVRKYQLALGLGLGSAYCAAGQYYCFHQASKALHLSQSQIPILKTGVANYMFNDAISKGRKAKYIPSTNDLLVWRIGTTWSGHIERIIEVQRKGWVKTVAFNTSTTLNNPKRKAQGVFIKRRNIFHFAGRLTVRGLIGFVPN